MRKFKYYIPIVTQKIGHFLFFFIHRLFVKLEIKGRENLRNLKGPIILAPNHTGELDVTAIPQVLPFFSSIYPIYFVTYPAEKYKTFGWRGYIYGEFFFNILGGYSFYAGQKNYAAALEDQERELKNGKTVCIFAEGKVTRDGQMNPGRGGLGYLVYTTGATVVPIAIDTFFHMTWWEFLTRQRKVVITVCKPLYKEELVTTNNPEVEDYRACSQKVLDIIKEKLTLNHF